MKLEKVFLLLEIYFVIAQKKHSNASEVSERESEVKFIYHEKFFGFRKILFAVMQLSMLFT